jgi:hypothetical protein
MANPEHVAWLKEGVEAWNARRARDDFKPDLFEADLQLADLRGADLRGADLRGADLRGADVTSAVGINDESTAEVTDLSLSLGLNQTQLDTMRGDSETILPDHLDRPKHWPKFEGQEESDERLPPVIRSIPTFDETSNLGSKNSASAQAPWSAPCPCQSASP